MSDAGAKNVGRFIPTLTEVIEEADLLNLQRPDEQKTSLAQSVSISVHNKESVAKPEEVKQQEQDLQPVTTGAVFVGNSFATKSEVKSEAKPVRQEDHDDGPVLVKDEELLQFSTDVFSSLSRNPGAEPDSLRPSDLMLVALTERIAAKARIRIEAQIEQHIQDAIFPLLDHFASQLVEHIQSDLVKIVRECIAKETREELEWLKKRNDKKKS